MERKTDAHSKAKRDERLLGPFCFEAGNQATG